METCYNDDCKKKQWLKLRQIRLQQVREQSKNIAKDVIRRAKENQEEQKLLSRTRRENVLQEWKKEKIKELEQKYNNAMKKVGLANKEAQLEEDPDTVLKENKRKDDHVAHLRGKNAGKVHVNAIKEAREKENAPIRRKEMAREIEDIRSGLVVQCRDWNVINQTGRQVILNVPVTDVDDFPVNQPKHKLPFAASPTAKTLKSSSRKSPSPKFARKSARSAPYSSPKRSPLVPNLDDLKSYRSEPPHSRERTGSIEERVGDIEDRVGDIENRVGNIEDRVSDIEEPLVEFYDHQAQYSRNYRLGGKLVESADKHQKDSTHPEKVHSETEDEELSLLIKKYASTRNKKANLTNLPKNTPVKKLTLPAKTTIINTTPTKTTTIENTTPTKTTKLRITTPTSATKVRNATSAKTTTLGNMPTKTTKLKNTTPPKTTTLKNITPVKKPMKSAKELAYTPPTKEDDFIPKKTNARRSSALKNSRSKKDTNSETKKLFDAIDKALEEGRQIRNEALIKSPIHISSNSSESESDSETDTIVKLVVNVNCGQHSGSEKEPKTEMDYADKCCQAEEKKKNVGTEIGASLRCDDELSGITPIRRVKKKSKIRNPVVNYKCGCKTYGCCSKCISKPMQRTSTLQDLAEKRVPETVCDVSPIRDDHHIVFQDKMGKSNHETGESQNTGSGQSTWCQTSYFSPPDMKTADGTDRVLSGPETTFKFNPQLDYYIRKLLDLPPDPCESSECTECRCQSLRSITSQLPYPHNPADSAHRSDMGESIYEPMVTSDSHKSGYGTNSNHCTEMDSTCFKSLPSTKTADASFSIKSSDYEAETRRRLERIAYLKQELEKIRLDKHLIETSSSLGSSSGKSKSSCSTQPSEEEINQITSFRENIRDAGAGLERPHHLSAIIEVDSRLIVSSPSSSSSDSHVSDMVKDLMKRGIITSPFKWSQGKSLSGLSDSNAEDSTLIEPSLDFSSTMKSDGGTTFNTLRSVNRPPSLNLSSTNASSRFVPTSPPEETIDLGSPERDLDQILRNLNVSKK